MDDILVSVIMVTYQHQKYIRNALESVLMQETSFPYEIRIIDDGSTDGTKKILKEYKKKYPDKIFLYLCKNNTGKATRNSYKIRTCAKGKYLAHLEGDDYWTDKHKLEKQVDFLENHKDYMGVFGRCKFVNEHEKNLHLNYDEFFNNNSLFTLYDIERGLQPGQMGAFMYRNIFLNKSEDLTILYKLHDLVGDYTLYCILLTKGNIGIINQVVSCYRIVKKKNCTSYTSIVKNNNTSYKMWKYYDDLEKYIKNELKMKINLRVRKEAEVRNAKAWLKKEPSIKNGYIFIKTYICNVLYMMRV